MFAPGSGKSGAVRPLPVLLTGHAVLDWDALMGPAAALAGRPIRQNPDTRRTPTSRLRPIQALSSWSKQGGDSVANAFAT
jgi:hypothetical protein